MTNRNYCLVHVLLARFSGWMCLIPIFVRGLQVRTCILEPWNAEGKRARKQPPSSNPIGWVREERDEAKETYRVQIGLGGEDNKDNVVSVLLPFFKEEGSLASSLWPSGLAASILCRTTAMVGLMKDKNVLELGAGLGLPARTIAKTSGARSVVLTDNDDEVVEQHTASDSSTVTECTTATILQTQRLEWRDAPHEGSPLAKESFDVILGADVAYYYFLLRPLMDTIQTFRRRHSSSHDDADSVLLILGQTNRESQWDLYHNIRDGCYNQLTDQREGPWPGKLEMLLYNLRMRKWHEESNAAGTNDGDAEDGLVAISVLVHTTGEYAKMGRGFFTSLDYTATKQDEADMEITF